MNPVLKSTRCLTQFNISNFFFFHTKRQYHHSSDNNPEANFVHKVPNSPIQPVRELCRIFAAPPSDDAKLIHEDKLRVLGHVLDSGIVECVLNELKDSWCSAYRFFSWAETQNRLVLGCYAYNAMARILSKSKKKELLSDLSKKLASRRRYVTPGALGIFIRYLGQVGLVEEAIYVFDCSRVMGCVPDSYMYNCLLQVLTKFKRCGSVKLRLGEMVRSRLQVDKFTMTAVIQAYCQSGKLIEGLNVFEGMCRNGWADEHAFTIVILALLKSGDVVKAFEIMAKMESMHVNLSETAYTFLTHGLKKVRKFDEAAILLDKMRKMGYRRDWDLYKVVIEGLCESKRYVKASELYLEMRAAGVVLERGIVRKLVEASSIEADFTLVKKLEDGKRLYGLNSISQYNDVLQALVSCGEFEKACAIIRATMASNVKSNLASSQFEQLTEVERNEALMSEEFVAPDLASFDIVFHGLYQSHKVEMALQLLEDMRQYGLVANLLIYNNLILELCKLDQLEKAKELMIEMKEAGIEPSHFTYNCILGCLCRRQSTTDALYLMIEMKKEGCREPWIKNYTILLKNLCDSGKVMEACKFLDDMVQSGFIPHMVARSTLIHKLCTIGEIDKALLLYRDLIKDFDLPDLITLNILISGLCRAGMMSEAEEILEVMIKKGLVLSAVIFNLMIDGWCKYGTVDLADSWFSKMVSNGKSPNSATLTSLVDGFCKVERADDALRLWIAMTEKGHVPNRISYMALIHGLCMCGRPTTAFQYYHEMQSRKLEADTYIFVELISAFLQEGSPVVAFNILQTMIEKGKCPNSSDKYYVSFTISLSKLYEDDRTCKDVHQLIEKGLILNTTYDMKVS